MFNTTLRVVVLIKQIYFYMENSFLSKKTNFSAPVSGSGASGKANPHSTKPLPSGRRARTKKKQLSQRRPLHVLFFFVPGTAHFFFSSKRKRNVGRNIPPFTREDQTRFTMRINTELLEQIKAEAEKNKRSAAKEIEYILEQYIKRLSE